MKKCKECKREVPGSQWAYKDDLCKRCYARRKYRESNPQYQERIKFTEESSKEDLMKIIHQRDMNISKFSYNINKKTAQIRHFRLRLLKMRNSLDYLLTHPFSMDTSYQGEKHSRDGMDLAHRKGSIKKARRIKNEESR